MSFPKKKIRRRGRQARERHQRRLLREQEAAAAQKNSQGTDPQLTTGVGAGIQPAKAPQDAPGRVQGEGIGEIGAGSQTPPQPAPVALFERLRETRSDVRMARRALLNRWRPKPEVTEAILTKASVMALDDKAKVGEVIAVGKLHLDAHRQAIADEHHGERLDYYDRALDHRIAGSSGPMPGGGVGVHVQGEGRDVSVVVFLPDNGRDPDGAPIVDLPPEAIDSL